MYLIEHRLGNSCCSRYLKLSESYLLQLLSFCHCGVEVAMHGPKTYLFNCVSATPLFTET